MCSDGSPVLAAASVSVPDTLAEATFVGSFGATMTNTASTAANNTMHSTMPLGCFARAPRLPFAGGEV